MNKSISNSNYSKKVPAPNENRFKNNNNYNDEGYIDNDVKDSTINKYNNKINNKNKYLLSSKTSNYLKDKRIINNFEEPNDSNNNKYYNQNNSNRDSNYYNNMNYNPNKNNIKTFYRRNNDNNLNNYVFQQNTYRSNKPFPIIQPKRVNIPYNNKYFNNGNTQFDDNDDDNEQNNINNGLNNNNFNANNIYDDNNYNNYIASNLIRKNNSVSINIEDIMVLEEKLTEIIYYLKIRKDVKNQCFDFWNYFYNSSLYQKIEKTFKRENEIKVIKLSINYELLSVMLCYEFSFDRDILIKTYILLLEILELNHRNLMLICENILNKISLENKSNIWVLKLNEIVQNSKKDEERYYQENTTYSEKISFNTDKMSKKLRNILLNYKTELSPLINSLLKKIEQKNYEEINDFFREYILRIEKKTQNININSQNLEFVPVNPPYILTPRIKPYTLVLGLDETLVNFQQINYTQGVLKLRPFLIEFLESVSQYYELILFTTETEYYAEPIIKAIEQKNNYFDYIFYKENCIIVGNDYVKDLTRIGRPLDSTIIVDNMPQYFRFQKENGIIIKSFWAQDPNDRALYDLIPILINIAEEEIDVRDGLSKYRNEIVKKVTSNISKNYI